MVNRRNVVGALATFGLTVAAQAPWRTLAGMLDHAHKYPDKVTYGHAGSTEYEAVARRTVEAGRAQLMRLQLLRSE